MQKYAIIKDGAVVNVIEYEEQPSNPPPSFDDTHIAVQADVAGPGYRYENGVFIAPPVVESAEFIEFQKIQETILADKQSAVNKLTKLGLTADEIKALIL
jgi:hypothetical protein